VSIASAGNGSSNHLAIELLMRQANLKLLHVPYKVAARPHRPDRQPGRVDDGPAHRVDRPYQGRRIKALAISSLKRSALVPNVRRWMSSASKAMSKHLYWNFVLQVYRSSSSIN